MSVGRSFMQFDVDGNGWLDKEELCARPRFHVPLLVPPCPSYALHVDLLVQFLVRVRSKRAFRAIGFKKMEVTDEIFKSFDFDGDGDLRHSIDMH